ncbi:helix-hairpin-helix domain-containing protein [Lewinella cohaerens]|uniref:helix-hairpin-helix domain-containing protein n=1 Tax=Lewinella cohaerens TaxID=70995 RepID=UPI000370C976|nr:helix-hairpin-helix domain-containing protein [Lewinella cohaerens]
MSNILLLEATGCCGCTLCLWWAIWTLGAFLLGALLHHLWFCKGKQNEIDRLSIERDGLHAQLTNAEKDMASLKYQLDEANKHNTHLRGQLTKCESDKAAMAAQAAVHGDGDADGTALGIAGGIAASRDVDGDGINYAGILGADNLQIIEGVGPKIEGLMKDGGIADWGVLAGTSVERLQEILTAAGSRYRLANPKTWPQQGKLAHEGKWEELIEYQKFLDAGVENKGDFASPSKVEKLIVKKLGYSTNPEDLKIVEGIGPKIEGLLKEAGIKNWSDMAAASVETLQGVLDAAGDRYRLAAPSTWAKQANLAAAGKWDELKTYQDFLSGGKNPTK